MSIELQDPVSVGRAAGEAVQRHAAEVADRARNVDLHIPVDAMKHARKQANRAARRIERRADHVSKRAAKRVRTEADRVSPPKRARGRRMVLLLLIGGAVAGAVAIRRKRQADSFAAEPDPFGRAVAVARPADEVDSTASRL